MPNAVPGLVLIDILAHCRLWFAALAFVRAFYATANSKCIFEVSHYASAFCNSFTKPPKYYEIDNNGMPGNTYLGRKTATGHHQWLKAT